MARRDFVKSIRRIRFLNKRLENSEVVDPATRPPTDQVFLAPRCCSAMKTVMNQELESLGIDEADATVEMCLWISPIARVFLKKSEGDTVLLPTPKGVKKLDILEVTYVGNPPGTPHQL